MDRLRAIRHGSLIAGAFMIGWSIASAVPPTEEPGNSPASSLAPEFRFSGDRVSFPIVMIQEFPFIAATIAGMPGKLLLDTGCEMALIVNDHRVRLVGGAPAGSGRFGSGQTLTRRIHATVPDVAVGPFRFPVVSRVKGIDARMIEQVTPDYLGWLGWHAWSPYTLKLDYSRSQATFYRGGAGASLAGEGVIATLPFATRKLPNTPIIGTRMAGMDVAVTFGSGQYGGIHTTPDGKRRLIAAGMLKPEPGGKFELTGLRLAGRAMPAVPRMSVDLEPAPAAGPVGIDEPTFIALGYGFLRHYTTVWDYVGHRLYLLAPGPGTAPTILSEAKPA